MSPALRHQAVTEIRGHLSDTTQLMGLVLGLVMPLAAAWIYPVYQEVIRTSYVELTRVLELPFVLCESVVIGWALYRGMELRKFVSVVPRDCLVAVVIMMVGVWTSTMLVSKYPEISLAISLTTVVHLLFGLALMHLIEPAETNVVERFAAGLAIGLAALAVLTVWRILLPPTLDVSGGVIDWCAAMPGFISVRHFGAWTGVIGALFAAVILNKRVDAPLSWHEGSFLLAATMTVWSGTRAAVLAMLLAVAIMIVSRWRRPELRTVARLGALTAAALIVDRLLPHPHANFQLLSRVAETDLTSGRTMLWAQTWARWLQAPWFGWGSGSTFWEVFIGWRHTQPHNFLLQFLISWGIVGTAGVLWLLFRATLAAHRRALTNPTVWPLNVALYALLIQASLEGMLHYPRFIMLIVTLYTLIFRCSPRGGVPGEQRV